MSNMYFKSLLFYTGDMVELAVVKYISPSGTKVYGAPDVTATAPSGSNIQVSHSTATLRAGGFVSTPQAAQQQQQSIQEPPIVQIGQRIIGEAARRQELMTGQSLIKMPSASISAYTPPSFFSSPVQRTQYEYYRAQERLITANSPAAAVASFGLGAARGAAGVLQYGIPFYGPAKFVGDIGSFGYNIAKSAFTEDRSYGYGIGERLRYNPAELLGELAGATAVAGYAVEYGLSKSPALVRETTSFRYYSPAGKPTKSTVTTYGVEYKGFSKPLLSVTRGEVMLEAPGKVSAPRNVLQLGMRGYPSVTFERLISTIPAPMTASQTKVLSNLFQTTKAERTRISAFQQQIRLQQYEPGGAVSRAIFDVEGIKDVSKASRIVEAETAAAEGVFFGSGTTKQLPKGYQWKPGDIDVIFPTKGEKFLQQEYIPRTVKRLQAIGEQVEISPRNPQIIQFRSGEKFLEAKAGIEPTAFSGEEIASAGGLGFKFPDLHTGAIGKTVPFGKAKAITAGEQMTRKTVASSFFRGEDLGPETPKEFSQGGIFPKGRRTKDIAGMIVSGLGISELQKASLNPVTRLKGAIAQANVGRILSTYTQAQQQWIAKTISEKVTGFDTTIILKPSKISMRSLFAPPRSDQISILTQQPEVPMAIRTKSSQGLSTPSEVVSPRLSPIAAYRPAFSPRISPGTSSASPKITSPRQAISPRLSSPISPRISPGMRSPAPSPRMQPSSPRMQPSSPRMPFPASPLSPLSPRISPRMSASPRSPAMPTFTPPPLPSALKRLKSRSRPMISTTQIPRVKPRATYTPTVSAAFSRIFSSKRYPKRPSQSGIEQRPL